MKHGKWQMLQINKDRGDLDAEVLNALNMLPDDVRESAQIIQRQFAPVPYTGAGEFQSGLRTSRATIYYFVPEAEPVPFVAVADGDPEFLPEPWKAPGQ